MPCDANQMMADETRNSNSTRTCCAQINVAAPACSMRLLRQSFVGGRSALACQHTTLFDTQRCKLAIQTQRCNAVRKHSLCCTLTAHAQRCLLEQRKIKIRSPSSSLEFAKELIKKQQFSTIVSMFSEKQCDFAGSF